MSIQNTISKLTRELISTFAQLDSWFDRDENILQRTIEGMWNGYQVLEHVSLTNRFLLMLIEKRFYCTSQMAPEGAAVGDAEDDLIEPDSGPSSWQRCDYRAPFDSINPAVVRATLRDQLYQLLCLLEQIPNGEPELAAINEDRFGRIDVYEQIRFLNQHARRHLVQLDNNTDVYETL